MYVRIFPYLVLARPANLVTAVADILTGAAIGGFFSHPVNAENLFSLILLLIATIGLYGGGVIFNDVFDAEVDRKERPERPIPSGQVSEENAAVFGSIMLLVGLVSATLVSFQSGFIALIIVIFALSYDKFAKHHLLLGPLFMGLCRGANLLLGMSLFSRGLADYWGLAGLPILFIAAITITSQNEVLGNNRPSLALAITLDLIVFSIILWLGFASIAKLKMLVPFLALWLSMNLWAKLKALFDNQPANIMFAVKMAVLSLIPLDACYTAGFANWRIGLAVLALLPVSMLLGKHFAVT
ncbi:MAG: UbiA-like protein EboC [Methylococcaceae bacterium]